jgi:hypothetical protein
MGFQRLFKGYSPYRAANLAEVDFVQSTSYAYFAHLDYPLYKLVWAGHTTWTFAAVTFGPTIAAPGSVAATPSQPNATGAIATIYTYYVTATDANGQESRASTGATVTNDLSLPGNYNTITWAAVATAAFYTVYKGDNASPGYIGMAEAGTLTFKDRNLLAILSDTPPRATNPFAAANDYPSTVTFHQQRLFAARTRNKPNAAWGSKTVDFENMDVSRPANPDDALSFALVAKKVNSISQLESVKNDLIALTTNGTFAIKGGDGGAMTPAAIVPEKQTGRGASRLEPILADDVLFYQPLNSGNVYAFGFTYETDGYRGNNVSIFSPHFFKARRIVSWAMQEEPYSCIWAALDNGDLLCFTWEAEQQVWGWTKMEADGTVEQVATIREGNYDRLYALIVREIAGVTRRFHERLALPHTDDITLACHLDCSVTQVFSEPTGIVGNLWHLEGESVWATYDGFVAQDLVVANGEIELPHEATTVTVGLPYEGIIETLPFVLAQQHVERQNIGDVVVRALETQGLEVSANGETFDPLPARDGVEVWNAPVEEARDFPITMEGNWTDGSTLTIRQQQPLPAHVVGIFVEIEISDDPK